MIEAEQRSRLKSNDDVCWVLDNAKSSNVPEDKRVSTDLRPWLVAVCSMSEFSILLCFMFILFDSNFKWNLRISKSNFIFLTSILLLSSLSITFVWLSNLFKFSIEIERLWTARLTALVPDSAEICSSTSSVAFSNASKLFERFLLNGSTFFCLRSSNTWTCLKCKFELCDELKATKDYETILNWMRKESIKKNKRQFTDVLFVWTLKAESVLLVVVVVVVVVEDEFNE